MSPLEGSDMYAWVKRVFDVAFASLLFLVSLPLWPVIMLVIKLESPGPVFYRLKVLGKGGQPFRMVKFRSMIPVTDEEYQKHILQESFRTGEPLARDPEGRPVYKLALADKARITRFGRLLRQTSLDELPQIWNVLNGEMSMVGPRPSLPYEAEMYDEVQRRRFEVLPGITGLYQVSARNHAPIHEMLRIDLEYVQKRNFWMDLGIVLRTPKAMFRGL